VPDFTIATSQMIRTFAFAADPDRRRVEAGCRLGREYDRPPRVCIKRGIFRQR